MILEVKIWVAMRPWKLIFTKEWWNFPPKLNGENLSACNKTLSMHKTLLVILLGENHQNQFPAVNHLTSHSLFNTLFGSQKYPGNVQGVYVGVGVGGPRRSWNEDWELKARGESTLCKRRASGSAGGSTGTPQGGAAQSLPQGPGAPSSGLGSGCWRHLWASTCGLQLHNARILTQPKRNSHTEKKTNAGVADSREARLRRPQLYTVGTKPDILVHSGKQNHKAKKGERRADRSKHRALES